MDSATDRRVVALKVVGFCLGTWLPLISPQDPHFHPMSTVHS